MNPSCDICDDETATMTLICYNCKKEWTGEKPYMFRSLSCKDDHPKPTFCGLPSPDLCDECVSKGYYIDTDSKGMEFFKEYTVKQK